MIKTTSYCWFGRRLDNVVWKEVILYFDDPELFEAFALVPPSMHNNNSNVPNTLVVDENSSALDTLNAFNTLVIIETR